METGVSARGERAAQAVLGQPSVQPVTPLRVDIVPLLPLARCPYLEPIEPLSFGCPLCKVFS